jgi:zinc D-Ala-D-Ala carboxypeptidase
MQWFHSILFTKFDKKVMLIYECRCLAIRSRYIESKKHIMKDIKISEHLSLAEICKSATATRLHIDNEPKEEHLNNAKIWAEHIFEPIRKHFGVPIGVISMFRCKTLNSAVGGSKTSEHLTASAGDLDQDGMNHGVSNKDVFEWAKKNLNFNQMIWEFGNDKNADWIHISYNCAEGAIQKKQILRASKSNGKTMYTVMK